MPHLNHIYYEETGRGKPIIFIHCPGVSHIYWRPTVERLKDTVRCITFDSRGHGLSGFRDQPWTFQDIAGDIANLTRRLRLEKPVLAGYSSGGAIALQAALQDPDLYGGIVIVSGMSECSTFHLRVKIRLGLLLVSLGLSGLVGRSVVSTNHVSRKHARAMMPHATAVSPIALRSYLEETLSLNLTPLLSAVHHPTLLVYGKQDDVMHEYFRVLQQGLPNARAEMVSNTSHRVPTSQPDVFTRLISAFVTTLDPDQDVAWWPMPESPSATPEHPTL